MDDVQSADTIYSTDDLDCLDRDKVPQHIAIVMDGNRRWAKKRGLPAWAGHWKGEEALAHIVRAASELGIKVLTVYAFSFENWLRSKEEVEAIMHLFKTYLEKERENMIAEGVKLSSIGDLSAMPEPVREALKISKDATAQGNKIELVLAMNYGGRDDIRRAFVAMMDDCEKGQIAKHQVSEALISRYLDTAKWPDPDLFIRSGGEKRQSNFLLWQLSYSEFYHCDTLWPDFDEQELLKAVLEYQRRERRFGGT